MNLLLAFILASAIVYFALKSEKNLSTKRAKGQLPSRRTHVIPSDGSQAAMSILTSNARTHQLHKSSRQFRNDMSAFISNAGAATVLATRFVALPAIAERLAGTPPVKIKSVNRHTSGGVEFGGSFDWRADGSPVITVSRSGSEGPVTILHELAHFAIDQAAGEHVGHTAEWEDTFATFINAAYPR